MHPKCSANMLWNAMPTSKGRTRFLIAFLAVSTTSAGIHHSHYVRGSTHHFQEDAKPYDPLYHKDQPEPGTTYLHRDYCFKEVFECRTDEAIFIHDKCSWIQASMSRVFCTKALTLRLATETIQSSTSSLIATENRGLQKTEEIPFDPEDLIVSVSFLDIYKVIMFIGVAWLLGSLSVKVGLPSLVGEIVTGFLLGPPVADFVPFPGAWVLVGNLGLIGLILESGIALDVDQLKEVGSRAVLMAAVGTLIPLSTGFLLGIWMGMDLKPAIAVGAAFAPSSLGVASNALSSGDTLNTPIGQAIVASSVFDDVFGLILLSILEVFADNNPPVFAYIIPFISSFGYLIVLGWLGITYIPRFIENRILPLVSENKRNQLAMFLMISLMVTYMLVLNYSRASFLTGVFLAGLSFSQLHMVHASFIKNGRPLLNWLLRIFFAATIGFQVPITRFQDPYVVSWGFALLLAVFAKVPIGFCVPRFRHEMPKDFPYNPYFRDIIVTALAMTCRGEFNVIVAAYALSEGLFSPEVYSAVIFAILFGSVVSPLALTRVLRYYNGLSVGYLEEPHPIERIGDTCDGYRPLFLAIQARTPVVWNLQETFKKTLEEFGLVIIDHRTWHTLGRTDIGQGAVDITELFAQDTREKVRISDIFRKSSQNTIETTDSTDEVDEEFPGNDKKDSSDDLEGLLENAQEQERIQTRCEEIKKALVNSLRSQSSEECMIQVAQWQTFVIDRSDSEGSGGRNRFFTFNAQDTVESPLGGDVNDHQDTTGTEVSATAARSSKTHGRSASLSNPIVLSNLPAAQPLGAMPRPNLARRAISVPYEGGTCTDLWEKDNLCHTATREGFVLSPDANGYGGRNITFGVASTTDHYESSSVPSSSVDGEPTESSIIRGRLHGYVRHNLPDAQAPDMTAANHHHQ